MVGKAFECRCPQCAILTWQVLPAEWTCECGARLSAALNSGRRGGLDVWTSVQLPWPELGQPPVELEA